MTELSPAAARLLWPPPDCTTFSSRRRRARSSRRRDCHLADTPPLLILLTDITLSPNSFILWIAPSPFDLTEEVVAPLSTPTSGKHLLMGVCSRMTAAPTALGSRGSVAWDAAAEQWLGAVANGSRLATTGAEEEEAERETDRLAYGGCAAGGAAELWTMTGVGQQPPPARLSFR